MFRRKGGSCLLRLARSDCADVESLSSVLALVHWRGYGRDGGCSRFSAWIVKWKCRPLTAFLSPLPFPQEFTEAESNLQDLVSEYTYVLLTLVWLRGRQGGKMGGTRGGEWL